MCDLQNEDRECECAKMIKVVRKSFEVLELGLNMKELHAVRDKAAPCTLLLGRKTLSPLTNLKALTSS